MAVKSINKKRGMRIRNEKQKKRSRIIKRVVFGFAFFCVLVLMFGVVYVFGSDAWQRFDPTVITEAPQSLLVYDQDGQEISCLSGVETRIYIPLERVPAHVIHAFISAEDARFYEHDGIDLIRIAGAAWADIKAGAYVQGASTISQQLIKLSHLTDEKVMSRKIEEAIMAYQMEQRFEKEEILEMYLNYVYFGGGFYGIEAAARGYFGVSVEDLSIAQSALLAGILKGPSRYAPHLNMKASTERRNLVLGEMNEYGYIDEQTLEACKTESVVLNNALNQNKRGYYVDLALQQACAFLDISMEELLTGGYRIHTAMDGELQTYSEELFKDNAFFPEEAQDAQAAMVVLDVKSGGVAAIMGGRESTAALEFNRAVRIRRQPGSVIKPIISYAPALEEYGYTAVTMLLDEPTDFNGYYPTNSDDQYRGWVTLRDAVTHSINVPAVKVLSEIGVNTGKAFAQSVGIEFDHTDTSLTLALGGFAYGVSPYQIAGAYGAFAAGGLYSAPSLVMRITKSDGTEVYTYVPEKRRVMSEGNAYILTNMMQSVIDEGTGRRLSEIEIALAGKTGTTGDENGNRDAWMAAYNPEYAAAVWIGYDDASIGRLPTSATGGSYPAGILSKVFEKLYETREEPDFIMPQEVIEVRLDQYSMEQSYMSVLASALTPPEQVRHEVFVKGTEPTVLSNYWVVPSPPNVFHAEMGESGYPRIRFKPEQDFVIYRLYRQSGQNSTPVLVKEWSNSLSEVQYEDTGAAHGQRHLYYIIPVHPQLRIDGKQVVGPSTMQLQVEMPSLPFVYQNR